MEWQPIETFKQEGVESYIFWDGQRVFTGWQEMENVWHCDQYADHASECDAPTHWMPLPTPPKA